MVDILQIIIGLLLLTLGRKLFWLFVGGIGFMAGLQLAQLYFGLQPVWMTWLMALLFGVVGVLVAIFFQTLAIGLAGFAAGSTIVAYFANIIGFTTVPAISFIGGIAGVILLYTMFDWALIGLSSIAGSTLIVQSLNITPGSQVLLYAALVAVGIVVQAALLPNQHLKTG
jgi:hypothetical protein